MQIQILPPILRSFYPSAGNCEHIETMLY